MLDDRRPAPVERFVRPVLLQEPAGGRIRCLTCERRCEVAESGLGWCRTRLHQAGDLVTLVYGAISSLSANPIEKKPLYHFYPGTVALTSGSFSCNFNCAWCHNLGSGDETADHDTPLSILREQVAVHSDSQQLEQPPLGFEVRLFEAASHAFCKLMYTQDHRLCDKGALQPSFNIGFLSM